MLMELSDKLWNMQQYPELFRHNIIAKPGWQVGQEYQ